MSKSRKADKPKNTNKSGISGGAGLILLALLLILAGAAYYAFQELTSGPTAKSVPVTGSKNDADFNFRCDTLHSIVDKVVAGQSLIVSDVHQEVKTVDRRNTDGKIRWNARKILIEATDTVSPEEIRRAFEVALKPATGLVLQLEPDQYHGYAVTRIDIGFRDQLGGGPLSIVSDRLYVVEATKKPVAKGARQKTNTAHKGEIALIIDDFGYRQDMIAGFAAIRQPFTFAVIPFKQFSRDAAAKGLASGHQVILHLPMEPMSGVEETEVPITVRVGMSQDQIRELIDRATDSLPGIIGGDQHHLIAGNRGQCRRLGARHGLNAARRVQIIQYIGYFHLRYSFLPFLARMSPVRTTPNGRAARVSNGRGDSRKKPGLRASREAET